MTTSDTTGSDATGSVVPDGQDSPRDIDTLLALGTYQGMTDAEIQSIIDYRVGQAHKDEETKAYQAAAITSMNDTAEHWNKAADESNDILKRLVSQDLSFGKIGTDGFPEKDGAK